MKIGMNIKRNLHTSNNYANGQWMSKATCVTWWHMEVHTTTSYNWPTRPWPNRWSLFSHIMSVRTSVHNFQNLPKQNKFHLKTRFTTGETVGLAEWIIDYICLVSITFSKPLTCMMDTNFNSFKRSQKSFHFIYDITILVWKNMFMQEYIRKKNVLIKFDICPISQNDKIT